jgi:asparagine synthase (glutamine-hydrolysing)
VFERWGIAGLGSLTGEWSVAIFDAVRRTIHLARDYMGVRPLCYAAGRDYAAWSDDLAALVERTHREDALSDAFAARYMSLRPSSHITPYDGIFAVPPGTCMSIDSTGLQSLTRIWTLQAGDIRYRDERAYEEHLRILWRDAVEARLQTADTVWAELSGGLDSSSVVCMAHRAIGRGAVAARSMRLVSHATLHSPEGDERRFIAEVERQTGLTSDIVGVEDNQGHADPDRAWLTPYALQGVGLEMARRMRAAGGRVVLSGRFGDAVMGCQPDNSVAVFDDLARGKVRTSLRNLRSWSRATRKPFIEIAWKLFTPADPPPADTGIELLAPRLREMLLDARPIAAPLHVRRSKRALARMILSYSEGARFDVPLRRSDIVYTFPFTHRPLIDFVLAIPGDQLSAPGTTRALMRRAFEGLLPPRIVRRISKGYYPPAAFRAARRLAASLLPAAGLEVVQRGWIDGERLEAAIRALTHGGGETGGDIHSVLGLERWLEARRTRTAIPQRKEVNTNDVLHA